MITFKEYPGIGLDKNFDIWNLKTGHKLKKNLDGGGYEHVTLNAGDVKKKIFVHRLVCLAYNRVDGCENLVVDHIDGNKRNNHPSNLEFITHAENTRRYLEHKRKKRLGERKPLRVDLCVLVPEVKEYYNINIFQAGRIINRAYTALLSRINVSKKPVYSDGTMIKVSDGKKFIIPKDIPAAIKEAITSKSIIAFNHFTTIKRQFNSIIEAAKYLRINPSSLQWRINEGVIKVYKNGWEVRYENENYEFNRYTKEEIEAMYRWTERKIERTHIETGEKVIYNSIMECCNDNKFSRTTLMRKMNGGGKQSAPGYEFRYVE